MRRRKTMTDQKKPDKSISPTESKAIRQSVLNYLEAWYQGDPGRGVGSLHPDLAKRIVRNHPVSGEETLENMSAVRLTERWGSGEGRATPRAKQKKKVTILDVYGGMASVKLEAAAWVDYMHLAKVNGQWVIVNVLWERKG